MALIFYDFLGFDALSSGLCNFNKDWAKEALTQFQFSIYLLLHVA